MDKDQMVVICESSVASKYSGMGGVGKTLTAKWYAHTYEQKYDHIIWIDCGEGSLLTSFKTLARDLKVEDWDGLMEIQDYSRKSFNALSRFKCLWIYDNAENYQSKDGIINVLPKYENNFYCIITSRSREWGIENVGYGKITHLELDIFSEEESLEFLKSTLLDSIERTDSELKKLCTLVENLPLALQLAVAALNAKKIKLQNYIDQTSSKDLGFLDDKFDDYEKTINKNIKISMDLILKDIHGKLAYDILIILGYIRPDDVRLLFLQKILKCSTARLEEAINLLENYALIAKTGKFFECPYEEGIFNRIFGWNELKVEMHLLSIHRLLQQVIRYNGRETESENETLRKILGCEGFIDYKFIPFTKYADEELRKEFPKVKAELLDQEQLKKLIREGRMEESVELARFIHQELKTQTSKFNLAICLEKNELLEESSNILKELEMEEMKETREYKGDAVEIEMLGLKEELSRDLVGGHLLITYWKMDKRSNIKELLEGRKRFQVINSTDSLDILVRLVHSDLIKSNYSLVKSEYRSTIELELGGETSKIELWRCSLDLSSFDRLSPEELQLWNVSLNRNGREVEEANLNEFCDFHKINKLTLKGDKMSIELSDEISMEYLCLGGVKVLTWKEVRWNIQRLVLCDIPFGEKTKMKVKEMYFLCSSLDNSCLPPTIEKLHLVRAEVVCNEPIYLPKLEYLTLVGMSDYSFLSSFRSPNLTHIHFLYMKEVNVDQIPKSVTHINIEKSNTIVVGGVRRMDKLILEDISFEQVKELLGHFQTDELVVYSGSGLFSSSFTPNELIELTKQDIKTIAVGRINWDWKTVLNWEEDETWVVLSHADRKADYYLWEGGWGRWKWWRGWGSGRGMEKKEFEEFSKWY